MPKFVEAVSRRTGRKQRVPAAWLDHPVIGEGFRETPRNTARKAAKTRTAKKAAAKKATATPPAPAAGTNKAPVTGDKE